MRRVMVNAFGGPEQLIVQRVSDELRPAPGQMLVDVEAAGVNYIDIYQRNGSATSRYLLYAGTGRRRAHTGGWRRSR